MKDATLTVRMRSSLRRRIEDLARREGRSLSQQVGRLIEQGIAAPAEPIRSATRSEPPPLSGLFAGSRVPMLSDFRRVRAAISASLSRGSKARASVPR